MPPLTDPELLARYKSALRNWNVTGYLTWKEVAELWLRDNLGLTPRMMARSMHDHVEAGGEIQQVRERRPDWDDYEFHYDLRLPVSGRLIYIETVLKDEDPTDPIVHVVSIHYA
ncbi:MAG TPA: hypothetical protein VKI65_10480 [Gemmataceae bacterium]|nr:hypothetical protein [Gemmataceae bacterium]